MKKEKGQKKTSKTLFSLVFLKKRFFFLLKLFFFWNDDKQMDCDHNPLGPLCMWGPGEEDCDAMDVLGTL